MDPDPERDLPADDPIDQAFSNAFSSVFRDELASTLIPASEEAEQPTARPSAGWLSGRLSNRLHRLIDPDAHVSDGMDEEEEDIFALQPLDEDHPIDDPIALRSLRWLKRNVSSLRVTVSVQRGVPAPPAAKPRKPFY